MIVKNKRVNRAASVVFVIATISLASSCVKKNDIKSGASTAFSTIKKGVGKGVAGVKSLTGGKLGSTRKNNRAKASEIASQFPQSQFPNTILSKPVATGTLTSGFGFRLNPAGIPIPKGHKGVDYSAPEGTAIYAAGDGVVVKKYVSSSFGKYIKIKHENGFTTAYAHMNQFADGVGEGTTVSKGQKIGEVGSTGKSTGPHLHFELHYNGKAIDPFFAQPLS